MDELNIQIGLICTVVGVLISYLIFMRNTKKASSDEGRESGAVLTEIGYVKSGIDDIKHKQEQYDEKLAKYGEKQESLHVELIGRLTSVEASAKQAHKRLDTIEGHNRPE